MFRVEPRGETVALLTMDDGKVNAIGPDFLTHFSTAWHEATREGRAVVLAGNAKAFSAGLDLKVLPGLERAELVAFARGFMQLFADVAGYERPTVAAVDGPALAGGAVLALACDFRHVGPRARLGLTEVPVGIPFPPAVAALARSTLPPQEHAPTLLQGIVREGEACVRAGWAHRLVEGGALVEESVALAQQLAASHPPAYASAKCALRADVAAGFAAFAKEGAEAWVDELTSESTMMAIVAGFERMTRR